MSAANASSGAGESRLLRIALPGEISLHYVEREGISETVILLHGGMGDCLSWTAQLVGLAPHLRVVSYSRRYHFPNRNTAPGTNHSSEVEAGDLDAFLRLLRCGPAHLIGASYGALTALTFAVEQPSQVLSLVLVEPPVLSWLADDATNSDILASFMHDVWQRARQHFDRGQAQLAMQILFNGMRGRDAFASLGPLQRTTVMRNSRAMEMLVRSVDPFPPLDKDRVARLQIPMLLVSGQRTVPIHRHVNGILARVLPRATHAAIKQVGHAAAFENPRLFNALVHRFLASLSNRSPLGASTEPD